MQSRYASFILIFLHVGALNSLNKNDDSDENIQSILERLKQNIDN